MQAGVCPFAKGSHLLSLCMKPETKQIERYRYFLDRKSKKKHIYSHEQEKMKTMKRGRTGVIMLTEAWRRVSQAALQIKGFPSIGCHGNCQSLPPMGATGWQQPSLSGLSCVLMAVCDLKAVSFHMKQGRHINHKLLIASPLLSNNINNNAVHVCGYLGKPFCLWCIWMRLMATTQNCICFLWSCKSFSASRDLRPECTTARSALQGGCIPVVARVLHLCFCCGISPKGTLLDFI